MARHKVEICGVNTANIKVLTNEEMLPLFKKIKEGDIFAKQELINGNLKLVLSILRKFNNRVDNMDDLFQVGCIGLIKAIDNFDTSHEVRFSTYAVPMILGEVKRYLRDNNSVRISRSIKDTAYKALRIKEELTRQNNQEPSIDMIAKEMGITPYEVTTALEAMREPVSMFEPIYNEGGDTIYLADQIADKKSDSDVNLKLAIKEALNKLRDKERYVINERYIMGKTQMELALEIGISQAQISRLEKSGLENIRKMIE